MTNMYIRRNIYDSQHFTVDELFDGEIYIRMNASSIEKDLKTAGNSLLNELLKVAEEIDKFSSTYIDPFAQTVRPRRKIEEPAIELESEESSSDD